MHQDVSKVWPNIIRDVFLVETFRQSKKKTVSTNVLVWSIIVIPTFACIVVIEA